MGGRSDPEESAALHERRLWLWAARPKGVAEIIGFAWYGFFHDPPELQLHYGLHPTNYPTTVRAVSVAKIIASADPPNNASIGVMQRLGMSFDRCVVKSGLDTIYYRLARPSLPDRDA